MSEGQPQDIHATIWSSVRQFEDWLVGVRRGFGTGRDALKCFLAVEGRSVFNWIIPGLGFLGILVLYALFSLWTSVVVGGVYLFGAVIRVFVFDYLIFVFGLLSGLNMARRWRMNPAQVEELSLVPLEPSVLGGIFASGTIRTWLRLLIVFAAIETVICIPHLVELSNAFRTANLDPLMVIGHPAGWLTLLTIIISPWVMAWFHFESIRLAHWMFAAHALPRVPLLRAAMVNFVTMTSLVIGLSGLGSAVTGIVFAGISLLAFFGMMTLGFGGLDVSFHFGYTIWMLAAVGGALVVLWLKRVISRQYEAMFIRSWLMYQWWGAGETTQPAQYPRDMQRAVPYWELYYRMREEELADLPLEKRAQTRRYQQYMKRIGSAPPAIPPAGGWKVVSPETLSAREVGTPDPELQSSPDPETITSGES